MRRRFRIGITKGGMIFLLFLFAMTIASTNYRNNMAYLFTFSMLSIFLSSIPFSFYNMRGVRIRSVESHTVFAGEEGLFSVTVDNLSSREKYGITASFSLKDEPVEFKDIEPGGSATFDIILNSEQRGEYQIPEIIIYNSYPFGFIRGLYKVVTGQSYIVFPAPGGKKELPPVTVDEVSDGSGKSAEGGEDFSGYRNFRPGESLRHVDWKAYARGRAMLIKRFDGEGGSSQWLRWSDVSGGDTERGVSQLTRWVLEAHKENIPFGLDIPGAKLKVTSDSLHTIRALTALALFRG